MTSSSLHKIYAAVIVCVIGLGLIAGSQYVDHARDDATRDATINAQKSDIATLQQKISTESAAAQAQIAEIEKQKQQVIASPAQAPTIIREVLPGFPTYNPNATSTPGSAQQSPGTAAPGKEIPDSPGYVLTQEDQQLLAQFILGCKQCSVERDQLQSQVADQQQVIDKQKTEISAAMKAAKGGSVWQRTKKALKYLGIGAIVGAVAAEAAHR